MAGQSNGSEHGSNSTIGARILPNTIRGGGVNFIIFVEYTPKAYSNYDGPYLTHQIHAKAGGFTGLGMQTPPQLGREP